jgi:hypothetical protein
MAARAYTHLKNATWSQMLSGDLSRTETLRKLLLDGYQVISENVPSPVGDVPRDSIVLTDCNGRRALWLNGKLYQKRTTPPKQPLTEAEAG